MAASSWYVIQVSTGAERKLCDLIERLSPAGAVEECFSPRYATQIKRAGSGRCRKAAAARVCDRVEQSA